MSSPNRGLSGSWLAANAALGRNARVVVQFRDRKDGEPIVRYSAGAIGGGALPFLLGLSVLPSIYDLGTLTTRIGDVTVNISTFDPASVSGSASAWGAITKAIELMGSSTSAPRVMDVLVGFGDIPLSAYALAWSGDVTAFPSMAHGGYSIRATDGMDLIRRLRPTDVDVPDLWGTTIDQQAYPARHAGELVSDLLVAASGDELDALGEDSIGKMWAANVSSQSDRDVDFPVIDNVLMRHVLVKKLLDAQRDPTHWVEAALLPAFGGFLTRFAGGTYALAELIPLDRVYYTGRSHWWPESFPTITDLDIVAGSASCSWSREHRIRSVTIRYGMRVWDAYGDEDPAIHASYPLYDPAIGIGAYTLEHKFEALPEAGRAALGREIDGRDVTIDAPYWWVTEADPVDDEITGEEGGVAVRLRGAPLRDEYGFPIPYQGDRRRWRNDGAWRLFKSHAQRYQWDMVHYMHTAAYRILRFGFPERLDLSLVLQSRRGAQVHVGQEIDVQSEWIPDTERRRFGIAQGQSIRGQVLAKRFDPIAGTVALSVSIPAVNPAEGITPFYEFENQVCHQSTDEPNGWGLVKHNFARWSPIPRGGADLYIADPRDDLDAVYWLWYPVQDEVGRFFIGMAPLASIDPVFGYKFHYVRFQLRFNIWGNPRQEYKVGVRVSLLGAATDAPVVEDQPYGNRYNVLWSHRREVFATTGDNGGVTFDRRDSICVPGMTRPPIDGKLRDIPQVSFAGGSCTVHDHVSDPNLIILRDFSTDFTQLDILEGSDLIVLTTDIERDGPFVTRIVEVAPKGFTDELYVENVPGWTRFGGDIYPYDIRRDVTADYDSGIGLDRPYLNVEPIGAAEVGSKKDTIDGQERSQVYALKIDCDTVESETGNPEEFDHGRSYVQLFDIKFHRMRFHVPSPFLPGPVVPDPFPFPGTF